MMQAMGRARLAMVGRKGGVGWLLLSHMVAMVDMLLVLLLPVARPGPLLHLQSYILSILGITLEMQAMDWVKRYKAGQEERDIILSNDVCRGWEVDTALVMDISYGVENMVMRAVAGLILVTQHK